MKTRNRTILNFVVFLTIMALTGQAGAGIQPRLEGGLSQPDAMVVTTRTSTTVAIDHAVVHLETGALRLVRGGAEGGFLQIEAVGLTPETRYMVLAGQTPVYAFSADSNGRYSARVTDQIQIEGSVMVRNSGRPFASGLSGLTVVDLSTGLIGYSGPDHAKREQIETTPLCGNHPQSSGQATVTVDGDFQMFMAEGWGLAPLAELMVIADGIPVGPAVADGRGYFFFVAGNAPGTDVPLPPELYPVTDIDEVLVVTPDQTTVLFGNFDDPCTGGGGGGGDPIGSGSISICGGDANLMIGWMDWVVFDDGLQLTAISAFELPPNIPVDIAFDSTFIGTVPTSEWGDFFVAFSSDPNPGELPLPPNAPPLDEVQTVDLTSGDVVLGSGINGEDCEWDDPPVPVDEDYTDLCPVDPGSFASGVTGWTVWDDGTENFLVDVFGLDPNSTLNLIVDGHDLGAFIASDRGSLNLFFSSNPGGDVLDLPAEIQPVSSIDQVSLVSPDGAPIVAGSFIDGCGDIPDPPVPVDEDYTQLCPTTANMAAGEVGWITWDDGTEQLMVAAFPLEPDASYQIIIDGFDLGFFDADRDGSLWVDFSSDPIFAGQVPLPEDVQPVSNIDVVEIRDAEGTVIVAGSFSEPCSMEWDFEADATGLCNDAGGHGGDSLWWMTTINGHAVEEGLFVIFWEAEDAMTYSVVIDGVDIGEMAPIYGRDSLVLVLNLGNPGDEPIPDELSPISGIDIVQIFDGEGRLVVSGSYSEPCSGDDPWDPGDGPRSLENHPFVD